MPEQSKCHLPETQRDGRNTTSGLPILHSLACVRTMIIVFNPSRRDAPRQPAVARARRAGGERHPHRTGRDASARTRRGAGTRGGLSRRIDGGRRRRRRHDRRGRQRAAGIVGTAGRDPARLGERAGARAFTAVRAARRGGGAGIRADAAALAGRGTRRRGVAAVRADARRRVRCAGGASICRSR